MAKRRAPRSKSSSYSLISSGMSNRQYRPEHAWSIYRAMGILKRVFGQVEEQAPKDMEEVFDKARTLASESDTRQVVLIRPDLSLLIMACPAAGSMPRQVTDQMEAIVSSATPRNIAVISPTGFAPRGG